MYWFNSDLLGLKEQVAKTVWDAVLYYSIVCTWHKWQFTKELMINYCLNLKLSCCSRYEDVWILNIVSNCSFIEMKSCILDKYTLGKGY